MFKSNRTAKTYTLFTARPDVAGEFFFFSPKSFFLEMSSGFKLLSGNDPPPPPLDKPGRAPFGTLLSMLSSLARLLVFRGAPAPPLADCHEPWVVVEFPARVPFSITYSARPPPVQHLSLLACVNQKPLPGVGAEWRAPLLRTGI